MYAPGRCPIAPPHTSLPPCLQRAASAPHAHLSIPRLLLSAPGRRPPASTSPWTGTSRKSRACATCSRYARACCLPSRHRTRASCLACSPPPLHTARAPEHLSPPSSPHLAVRLQLQPAPGLGRRASHEHGIHVLCTPGPLPHRASAHESLPPCLQPAPAAPHARLSTPRLALSAPGSAPPASTSPWTGTSRKSRAWLTCSMYARAAAPSRPRTRASRLACSPPPLHPTRA